MRHGQTEANVKGLCSGTLCPSVLTREGRWQVEKSASKIAGKGYEPDRIYVTDTPRTKECSNIMMPYFKKTPEIISASEFSERGYGEWEGKPYADFLKRNQSGDSIYKVEQTEAFNTRVLRGIKNVCLHSDHLDLVISHGGVWQSLFDHNGIEAPWIENGDVYLLHINKINYQIGDFVKID